MNKSGVLKYLTNNHLTYDELVINYNKSLMENSKIKTEYDDLFDQYLELEFKFNKLKSNHNKLKNEYIIKDTQYNTLQEENNEIKSDIKVIKKDRTNMEVVFIKFYNRLHNFVVNIKPSMEQLLNIVDEVKEQINDNHYLESMNILKKIFDETKSFKLEID